MEKITQAAAAGNTRRACAAYAGIGETTLYRWIAKGENGEEGFREFWESLRTAEAQAEVRAVTLWQQAMPDSWQACRDFLARRFPSDWGAKDRHEITGANGGPITIADIARLAREEEEPPDGEED